MGGLIRAGRVTVNGAACRDPACKVDADVDTICVDGVALRARERYFMLNKPMGVVFTRSRTRLSERV